MEVLKNAPISFPGLFGDWQFTPGPVAFTVGNHPVYWYGILMACGVLLGLLLCSKQAKRFGLKEDNLLDLVLWGVPVGILGARTYYVIFYLDLYRNADGKLDFGRMIAIWDGGLAIYGTVIATLLLALIYCRRHHIRLGAMTDLCVMGLLVGQVVGRWGNFMNREAFGAETTLPWRMRLWTSVSSYIEVHPTFLYESLWNLIGLALIFFVVSRARRFDGESTWFYFLWYGLGRFWIEGLRTDSLYLFNWTLFGERIRVSQALSLAVAILSAFMLFYRIRIQRRTADGLMVNQTADDAPEAGTETASSDAAEAASADAADASGLSPEPDFSGDTSAQENTAQGDNPDSPSKA